MHTNTVDFFDGQALMSSGTLSMINGLDETTWITSTLSAGSHNITAIYSGDNNFLASTAVLMQNVNQSSTVTQLTSSLDPSSPGDGVTFTAAVSGSAPDGNTPSGSVTFYDGSTSLGSGTLSVVDGQDEATYTALSLPPGSQEITAVYSGDGTFLGNSADLLQNVNWNNSSVQLTSSLNPSSPGDNVTFTAVVSGSDSAGDTPSGTVTFYSGSTSLGSGTLSVVDGQDEATLQTSALVLGSQEITAVYGGDSNFQSSAATLTQSVVAPAWQGPSFSWSQTPVANPTVTTPSAQTNTEGDTVSLQIQASDPNGYPLSYDAVDLPPGLSIDSSTGLISGTVADGAAEDFDGSYNPTIIVANNQGGSATTSFSWTINQAQIPPVLTSPGNQSNLTGDNVNLQITATQADSDPISYDATNLPDGLSIDPDSGIISGTVAPDAASFVFTVPRTYVRAWFLTAVL